MQRNKFAALIIATAISTSSCNRNEPTPVEVAGKGGTATIKAIPKHHSKFIDSCTIYIKYNTSDAPSTTFNAALFDDSAKCIKATDGTPTATFYGLKKGNYFLYGVGWDTTIVARVEAGKQHAITADGMTYTITIPVTEGD